MSLQCAARSELLSLVISLSWVAILSTGAVGEEVPFLEGLDAYASPDEYVQAAACYLRKSDDPARNARVAHDLLIYATVNGDDELRARTQAILLADFPDSLFAKFVLHQLERDDIRELVDSIMKPCENVGHSARGRWVRGVIHRGLEKFDASVFGERLARTSVLVGIVEVDHELREAGLNWLKNSQSDLGEAVSMAVDRERPDLEKVEALTLLAEDASARYLQQHLLNGLDDEKQNSLARLRADVVNMAVDDRLSQALSLLEDRLDWMEDPQLSYLYLRSLLAVGDNEKGLAHYEELRKHHPDSDWTKCAGALATCLRTKEAVAQQLADHAQAIEQDLLAGNYECYEIELELPDKLTLYAALDLKAVFMDIALVRGEEQLMRITRDGRYLKLYSELDGPRIRVWNLGYHTGLTLGAEPYFTFREHDNGDFYCNFNLRFRRPSAGQIDVSASIAELRRFLRLDCMERFLAWRIRQGNYLLVEHESGGAPCWRLGTCSPVIPQTQELRCLLSTSGAIKEFVYGQLRCNRIQIGKRGDFVFRAPAWPTGQVCEMSASPVTEIAIAAVRVYTDVVEELWTNGFPSLK
ncbi:hypothetical protein OAS39_02930 [Pirellulales bacterium]|nr:hypothetical protein [Pirellulales bacterium]